MACSLGSGRGGPLGVGPLGGNKVLSDLELKSCLNNNNHQGLGSGTQRDGFVQLQAAAAGNGNGRENRENRENFNTCRKVGYDICGNVENFLYHPESNAYFKKCRIQEEEYADEIWEWLLDVEPHLTAPMRRTLSLWLIQVSLEFKLDPQSLFHGLSLLDRVCSIREIQKDQYQLLGVVCLWIAAKINENHGRVPIIERLRNICCWGYDRVSFLKMERLILGALGFYLQHVSSYELASVLCFKLQVHDSRDIWCMTLYLIETSLVHYRFVGVKPSLIARAAVGLAMLIINGSDPLQLDNPALYHETFICQTHLRDCLVQQPAVLYKKYSDSEFRYVAKVVEQYNLLMASRENRGLLTPPKEVIYRGNPQYPQYQQQQLKQHQLQQQILHEQQLQQPPIQIEHLNPHSYSASLLITLSKCDSYLKQPVIPGRAAGYGYFERMVGRSANPSTLFFLD